MTRSGRIHSYETLGTLDGPGIRTVFFLQGCPLRCLYCHNPDTWDLSGGKSWSISSLMNIIEKYRFYYEASDGGVTVSGGEPALQPEFVFDFFKACQQKGIHTALDTSGLVDSKTAELCLAHADLVLLDLKHMNNPDHIKLTGQNNQQALSFARLAESKQIPLWIRQVLLPGWTDTKKQLLDLADFCSTLSTLQKLEVLPYHRLGIHKWEKLNLAYPLKDIAPPTEKQVRQAVQVLKTAHPALPVLS